MEAVDFLKNKGITKATCYTDGGTYYASDLAKLLEEYAALRQPPLIERSEQLTCKCGLPKNQKGNGFSCIRTDCDMPITN